jgi:hypothetical protein
MSIFRVDYDLVSQHIRQLISTSAIGILHQYNDTVTNREIVSTLVKACRPLPLRYFIPIAELLLQINPADASSGDMIRSGIRNKRLHEKWDIYKWVVMLIITTLVIWLMIEFAK